MSDRTLGRFRDAYYRSGFFENLSLEAWQAQGCPQAVDRLRELTSSLLQRLEAPDDHADLVARGESFIHALQRD
jgi:trimethylamine:corrinoid methyltransferase-like protein